MSYFDSDINSYNDLIKYENDPNILKFLKHRLLSEKYTKYSSRDEKKLLLLLNTPFNTVEDYILSIKDKKVDELTPLDIFSFTIYGLKFLDKNGITGHTIHINNINISLRGGIQEGTRKINVYKNSEHMNSVYDIIKTLHHECMHAIEYRNTYKLRFDLDDHIITYIKDRFIKFKLGESYYTDNYFRISYEYDAEFKAIMLTDELFKLKSYRFQECKDFVNYELANDNSKRLLAEVEKKVNNRGFDIISIRIYGNKVYSLNELYDKTSEEFIKKIAYKIYTRKISYDEARRYIKSVNPLLYYDSSFTRDSKTDQVLYVWRKTLTTLVEDIKKAESKREKEIYYRLIANKIDPRSGYYGNDRNKLYNQYVREFRKLLRTVKDETILARLIEIDNKINKETHSKAGSKKDSYTNIRR